jgi:hypothetical protein
VGCPSPLGPELCEHAVDLATLGFTAKVVDLALFVPCLGFSPGHASTLCGVVAELWVIVNRPELVPRFLLD